MTTLELLLRRWQDVCFLLSRMNAFCRRTGRKELSSNTGALVHYEEIRAWLLSAFAGHESASERTYEDFQMPNDVAFPSVYEIWLPLWRPALQTLGTVPKQLLHWTCSSRRIYSLSKNLVLSLAHVSLRDVRWSDLHFPFECYVIELEEPIPSPFGDIDMLFVTLMGELQDGRRNTLSITPYPVSISRVEPLSKARKKQIRSRLGQLDRISEANQEGLGDALFLELVDRLKFQPFYFTFDLKSDGKILDAPAEQFRGLEEANGLDPERVEAFPRFLEQVLRIALGFNLYLRSRRPPASSQHERPPTGSTQPLADPTAIIFESEVTKLGSEIALPPDLVEGLRHSMRRGRDSGFSQSWHFREGHWRRPPGLGSDPDAEKTVMVHAYMVRRDRKPDGNAIPGGAKKSVH
ncbi:MAG: hypothetical protein KDD69_19365 [Bdellovibrionales bacterium]|nr:hypothetical protein [Bdellovibrionales bacterium]